jgi:hypothetical protein
MNVVWKRQISVTDPSLQQTIKKRKRRRRRRREREEEFFYRLNLNLRREKGEKKR